ncbi:glycosyltransferase family 4 protein [Candidatus Bipolaricaulota bacterium]|nr:glycosyltransferase family 4 protein [Candidatus Bipolaricaulota bacterium]MBS3814274.1 glycosyltransferase family 4 protein [Candidatus Bipolaricaulota bacterium]
MSNDKLKKIPVTFLATYPPRKCGIGTFTHDLARNVSKKYGEELSARGRVSIAALNDRPEGYDYDSEVGFEINAMNRLDYRRAADYVNLSDTKVVNIQHEYGIFGGEDGDNLFTFLESIRKPVVSTLHTILDDPSPHQREVLEKVCAESTEVVVLANKGKDLLKEVYDVPGEKVTMIPHGAPDVPFLDTSYYKEDYGVEGRPVILTFGLLGPNKGVEVAIEAMERVADEFPESLYIILGATHPHVKETHGEEYRLNLERMVKERGLQNNVAFHEMFVPLDELIKYLVTSDIYLTPYLSRDQISSGTLAYAVALGNAVVSTPYWYAEELLADGRGKLVPFEDPDATAGAIVDLLGNEGKRQQMRRTAYQFGRDMIWHSVAGDYQETYERALKKYKEAPAVSTGGQVDPSDSLPDLPEVKLDHLFTLTDDTGIYQHASYTVPNREFGYTTDDNARAAIVSLNQWNTFGDKSALKLLRGYLSFLGAALNSDKNEVRNFLSFDREWKDEGRNEDPHGRLLWATGKLVRESPNDALAGYGNQLFRQAVESVSEFTSPRAWAFSILGIRDYLGKFGGDRNRKLVGEELADKLLRNYKEHSTEDWIWPEDSVTYENPRLPQALIVWGEFTSNDEMKDWGLRSLRWLNEVQKDQEEGHISLIGNDGWLVRGEKKADFDQQPVEAAALIEANWEAYRATEDLYYLNNIYTVFNWFLGRNDLGIPLYDFRTGGCKDGLHPSRVNENEGAESLVSWLISLQRMYRLMGELNRDTNLYQDSRSNN